MRPLSQKLLLILVSLAVTIGCLWEFFELPDASARVQQLPLLSQQVLGREVGLSSWEKTFFKKVNVVKRFYRVGDQKLFLTILDGTRNRHAVHDPFYCFRGSGWEVIERRAMPVKGGEVSILRLQKDQAQNEAMFWFSDGTSRHASIFRYVWQTTIRKLTLGRSGPEPVLIMIQPIGEKHLDWDHLVKDFPEVFDI